MPNLVLKASGKRMADASGRAVLVIDDTKTVQSFAEDFFRRLKLKVFVASEGYEGLQVAISSKPDLILLDLMMPRLDGFKTLQAMKSNEVTKNIPVVVMTAYSDRMNVMSAGKLGAAAVITKPLTEEVLLHKLRQVFGENFVGSVIKTDPTAKETPFGVNEDESSDVAHNIVAEFVRYFREQIDVLEIAIRKKDVDTIRKITHNISGTGGSFGYDEANTLSRRLNETVNASPVNWREAEDFLVQLKNRLNR